VEEKILTKEKDSYPVLYFHEIMVSFYLITKGNLQ
jgi:hypothetical protein